MSERFQLEFSDYLDKTAGELDPFVKEGFLRGLGKMFGKSVNFGKRIGGTANRTVQNAAKNISTSGTSAAKNMRGNIAVAKSNFKSGYTGQAAKLKPQQIKNQANLKAEMQRKRRVRAKNPNQKPNLPKDIQRPSQMTPTQKLMNKGKDAWNKLTPGQKTVTKGTAAGVGVVGAGAMLSGDRRPAPRQYQQSQYR